MKRGHLVLALIIVSTLIIALFQANKFFAASSGSLTMSENPTSTQQIATTPQASLNIEVLSPLGGDSIKSGFVVKGNARTFESMVNIKLLDSSGNILAETFTTANAPDVGNYGPFEKMLNFQTDDSTGALEVFQYSTKDGSEIDKVTIPLVFNQI